MTNREQEFIRNIQDSYLISKADFLYYRIDRIWNEMCSYYDYVNADPSNKFIYYEQKEELDKIDNNIEVFEVLRKDVNEIMEDIKSKAYTTQDSFNIHESWFKETWNNVEKCKKLFEVMLTIMNTDKFRLKEFGDLMEY